MNKIYNSPLSKTSIHNFLQENGLGTKHDRVFRVINSIYKIHDPAFQRNLDPEQQKLLNLCFKNRIWLGSKPRKNFIFLRVPFPIRFFRRKDFITFILDTFDYSACAVIDERAFFDPDQHQTLNMTIAQQGIEPMGSNRDTGTFLAWYLMLFKGELQRSTEILISTLKMPTRRLFSLLEYKLQSFPISLSYTTSTEAKILPWVKYFLDQLAAFRAHTLDEKLNYASAERHSIRLNICTAYLHKFLSTYNQAVHPYFPFCGLSPNNFRYSEKPTQNSRKTVVTMFDLLMSRDRSSPNEPYPSMGEFIESSVELVSILNEHKSEYEITKKGSISCISKIIKR